MRLIDCFIEALAFTQQVKAAPQGQDYHQVRQLMSSFLDSQYQKALEGGYSQQQYRQGLFAAVAYIDETLVAVDWAGKTQWARNLLQRHYFDTANAGVEFYDHLSGLNPFNPAERDIREVYYYSLMLGFQGKFFGSEGSAKLNAIQTENHQILAEETSQLFPAAVGKVAESAPIKVKKNWSPLLYGGPVLAAIGAFFYFKKALLDLANILVISV